MAYTQHNPTTPAPTQNGTEFATSTRRNLNALRDACIMGGGFPGFALTVTNGTGTAAQPQYLTYKKGTEWIRATLTWVSGNVTVGLYEYSSNSGTLYEAIGTKTITYDGSSNVTATTWS